MKNPLILTIDFGTQSVRASIFDKHGNCLAIHKKVYEPAYHSPKNGYAEQDPEYYYSFYVINIFWNPICSCFYFW